MECQSCLPHPHIPESAPIRWLGSKTAPCTSPIRALWVKGYVGQRGGVGCLRERKAGIGVRNRVNLPKIVWIISETKQTNKLVLCFTPGPQV